MTSFIKKHVYSMRLYSEIKCKGTKKADGMQDYSFSDQRDLIFSIHLLLFMHKYTLQLQTQARLTE